MSFAQPILLVESDRMVAERLAQQLAADGYRVEVARTVPHARMLAAACPPRLAVIGRLDGSRGAIELIEEIRLGAAAEADGGSDDPEPAWDRTLPVLAIGAGPSMLELLRAFEAGADDVARGAAYLELRARVRAVLGRVESRPDPRPLIEASGLRIDLRGRTALLNGRRLDLRKMEFELLAQLAREPDRTFTRQELLRAVWGYRSAGSSRTVDTHASRLRAKLTAVDRRSWLVAARGVGYRLI